MVHHITHYTPVQEPVNAMPAMCGDHDQIGCRGFCCLQDTAVGVAELRLHLPLAGSEIRSACRLQVGFCVPEQALGIVLGFIIELLHGTFGNGRVDGRENGLYDAQQSNLRVV
jgi:hypothetical protein